MNTKHTLTKEEKEYLSFLKSTGINENNEEYKNVINGISNETEVYEE